jgi:hypothetical protein
MVLAACLAHEKNINIQMIFPMADIVGLLQEGVGHLLREAGLALMNLVMEEEVRHLAGERHQQRPDRHVHRWGKEDGYCVVDGQKAPLRRTRLRSKENREQRLGSYELFQRSAPREHAVWDKMMRGLSTRNYGAVVKDFREAYGGWGRTSLASLTFPPLLLRHSNSHRAWIHRTTSPPRANSGWKKVSPPVRSSPQNT